MKRACSLVFAIALACGMAAAQNPPAIDNDVLGVHNMSAPSGSSVYTQGSLSCSFCHAPHSGIGANTPLWNQKLSTKTYTPYTSSTYNEQGNTQPTLGVTSSLCLSCHDGSVAVGTTQAYGRIPMTGSMRTEDSFGTMLTGSHPFSLVTPIQDSTDLAASIVGQGKTADPTGAVKLVNGSVECTSCHNPHVQAIDKIAQNFLVRDSSNGQLCLSCHDPNRVVQGKVNPLTGYTGSIHETATNQVSPDGHVGLYLTVGANSCSSCHMEHNSPSTARLLRPATPASTGTDAETQSCITCHNGSAYVSPSPLNVMAETVKTTSHPLPAGTNVHDAAEPALLNNNRHATCVDCHNPHAGNAVSQFTPAPGVRPSQGQLVGISALDGNTVLRPSVNQYENCLRCHGTGAGKQELLVYGYAPRRLATAADPLNVIPEFASTATSSHPVTHPRQSVLPQPSLLPFMLNLNGTQSARSMEAGTSILCTDCHNSDDNREFGGKGPNGPHGSVNSHVLERNYQFSQAAIPGSVVTNLFPTPDTSFTGPYAMCAKCHDLTQVLTDTSWAKHGSHVSTDGFSCSVCHTSHGMGGTSPNVTGERMVNFDVRVVGLGENGAPITYNRSTGTCTLTCHQVVHLSTGLVVKPT